MKFLVVVVTLSCAALHVCCGTPTRSATFRNDEGRLRRDGVESDAADAATSYIQTDHGHGYDHGYPLEAVASVPVSAPVHTHAVQTVEVAKEIPVPVAVPVPVPIPVPIHIVKPVHIVKIKTVAVPVEKLVEKLVPYEVEKRVPYPVEKPYPVTVEKPYPIHVPVYRIIYKNYPSPKYHSHSRAHSPSHYEEYHH